MTVTEQLRHLSRQFPNSRELAVSQEMADGYEQEIVANLRYGTADGHQPFVFVAEIYPAIKATKLPLGYRDRRLTLVESR
jgi:hypothetical protein